MLAVCIVVAPMEKYLGGLDGAVIFFKQNKALWYPTLTNQKIVYVTLMLIGKN